jgi:hypothetical protein
MQGSGRDLFEVLPGFGLGGLRKTTKLRLVDGPSEFRTEPLPDVILLSAWATFGLEDTFWNVVFHEQTERAKDMIVRQPHVMNLRFVA